MVFYIIYFLLRRAIAAATTTIMITAAAMATYVTVGIPTVGGGATLGEGEVEVGVGVVGTDVGTVVGAVVGVVITAGEGAGITSRYVADSELK